MISAVMGRSLRLLCFLSSMSLFILAGCDDDPGSGPVSGACDLGSTGDGATLSVAVDGASIELEQRSTQAMNTLDVERGGAVIPNRFGPVQWGACDHGGVLFVRRDNGTPRLVYLDVSSATPSEVGEFDSAGEASLMLLSDCTPAVMVMDGGAYVQLLNDEHGWTSEVVLDPETDLPGDDLGWVSNFASDLGRDGRWHVFAHSIADETERLIHGVRDLSPGSAWTFEVLPWPEASEVYDFAVDSDGVIHTVYRNTDYPCDPCDVTLYYARLDSAGDWVSGEVQRGVWGPPHDLFSVDASLTIDGEDRPVIAAQLQQRVETGSLTSAALWVYFRQGEEFCAEEVADESDGYAGSDGTSFTGSNPTVAVDGTGRVHVLFTDLAAWHDSNGSNTINGQVRYAIRAGSSWQLFTLVEQPGQTQSPEPLVGAETPSLALSASGNAALFVVSEWEWATRSIYNSSEVPLELRAVARLLEVH